LKRKKVERKGGHQRVTAEHTNALESEDFNDVCLIFPAARKPGLRIGNYFSVLFLYVLIKTDQPFLRP